MKNLVGMMDRFGKNQLIGEQKIYLIAQHQIKPILNHLEKIIILLISLLLFSLLFILLEMN